MQGTREEDDRGQQVKPNLVVRAALVGVLLGAVAVLVFFLIRAVVDEGHDASKIKTLAESNQQRLAQQAKGVTEGLDILCKLKKYDLTTGLPALKARRERGSPEYDPARALILERALLLVISIPSAANCLALPAPASPATTPHGKAKRPSSAADVLRELERSSGARPPSAQPRIERESTVPHRRTGSTTPLRPRRAPVGGAPATGTPTPSTPTVTTTTPAAAAPAPAPVATPASPPPTTATTPATTPTTTPAPAPAPPPVAKKHGPLGVCVEALGVEVLC